MSKLNIVVLLLATSLISSALTTCTQGCVYCNQKSFCEACFRRPLTAIGTCGAPNTKANCDIFSSTSNPNACSWCAKGYGLNVVTKQCTKIAAGKLPPNCRSALALGPYVLCPVCDGGKVPSGTFMQ